MKGIYQLFGILCCIYYVSCKPNGAPPESCFYMTPRHIHPHTFRKVFPTRAMGLYNITTSADVFRPDRPIRVTLWGPPFKGFMMVAAEEGAKDWPTGIFYSEDGSGRSLSCLGRADTITHQNNSYKDSVSVLWYGPENMMSENIQFIATVVVNLTIYYTNIKSGFVRLDPTLAQTAGGGENGPVAVTMDPWLSGGGNSVTQAPVNWWSLGAAGGTGRKGAWGSGGSFGSISGLGTAGSSSWGTGTGSSWNSASGNSGSSWSGGNKWQAGGSGPSTVSSWQYQNPGSNQPSSSGVKQNWDSKANSVWTWNSGPTTETPPVPAKTGQSNTGGSGSSWSASSIVDILRQLVGGGGAAAGP